MSKMTGIFVVGLLAGFMGVPRDALAQQDKSSFTLFNPTPRELMRPLSADRPDATESPVTVDAGHIQIETSFVTYSHDHDGGAEVNAWNIFDTNLKIGVTNNVDLQFVFSPYGREHTDPDGGGASTTLNGISDVQIRAKINLWGNDGDTPGKPANTAFGIMPFIKIPNNSQLSNREFEGGFIAMLGWDVGETWGLGFQGEIDVVYDDADDDYDLELSHTVVLGFDVVGALGAYVEYLGLVNTDDEPDYQAIFSGGMTYAVNDDLTFDVGTQIGLTQDADDVVVFAGMTLRY